MSQIYPTVEALMKFVDEFYSALGSRIRSARTGKDMNQQQLADAVNLNRTSITNIEKGKQRLLIHTFVDLLEALQVEPNELLPRSGKPTKSIPVRDLITEDASTSQISFLRSVLRQKQSGASKNESSAKSNRKTR